MSIEVESNFEGWDRACLNISSTLSEPFCSAWNLLFFRLIGPLDPAKFENCSSKTTEVAVRTLIVLGAALALFLAAAAPIPFLGSIAVLGIASRVFRAVGFALQKEGFTHVRGQGAEITLDPANPQIKIMTLNVCGVAGGLSIDHGGVVHWQYRIDKIADLIRKENPDVLVLQEIYDAALGEALIERLNKEFAHFYIQLGPNSIGGVGGCMAATKMAVDHFSHTSFSNNAWTLNRGVAMLEVKASPQASEPCARIMGTHLIDGNDEKGRAKRQVQIANIVDAVAQRTFKIPTVLAGDLNIERDSEEGKELEQYVNHSYLEKRITRTSKLVAQWGPEYALDGEETIDNISLFKRLLPDGRELPVVEKEAALQDCHLIETFDSSFNTQTAISDHHGMGATLQL